VRDSPLRRPAPRQPHRLAPRRNRRHGCRRASRRLTGHHVVSAAANEHASLSLGRGYRPAYCYAVQRRTAKTSPAQKAPSLTTVRSNDRRTTVRAFRRREEIVAEIERRQGVRSPAAPCWRVISARRRATSTRLEHRLQSPSGSLRAPRRHPRRNQKGKRAWYGLACGGDHCTKPARPDIAGGTRRAQSPRRGSRAAASARQWLG
jgi:hypothetical protein